MEDNLIIELYLRRSELAIAETSAKYGRYCHSIALNILGDFEHSEECVNDTFLAAWNAIPPQNPANFRAYLGKICRNLSLNLFRDMSREKRGGGQVELSIDELNECIPDNGLPEQALDNQELVLALETWLSSLRSERRFVFMRRYWYCDSLADISARMGWAESKTGSLLRRLRISLKKHLESEGISL